MRAVTIMAVALSVIVMFFAVIAGIMLLGGWIGHAVMSVIDPSHFNICGMIALYGLTGAVVGLLIARVVAAFNNANVTQIPAGNNAIVYGRRSFTAISFGNDTEAKYIDPEDHGKWEQIRRRKEAMRQNILESRNKNLKRLT